MPEKEPVFGPNAKPFFLQFALAIVLGVVITYFFGDWFYDLPCYIIECQLPARSGGP